MYKKAKKSLKNFLNSSVYNDELFSRSSMNTIIRALLEPVANQNAASLLFTRFKNKEGLEGLVKRLEYCTNVEMVDVTAPGVLIKDDYIELEFIIFTSARYNFALLWDYSNDTDKNYTKGFFLANSRSVNDVYEILQANLNGDYRDKFYLHKPERRENELLNEALFNVFKKLNNSIEENLYKGDDDLIVDLSGEDDTEEKIRECGHEIKNQLSIIDVYTRLIEKKNGKAKETEIIKKACSNIGFQITELKNYSTNQIKELVLQDIIEESAGIFEGVLHENRNQILIENKCKYDICVFADENKLLSVLNNLLKNANEAAKNDTIIFEINIEKGHAVIDVKNHGDIIPHNKQKMLFEKGFTTKQKGNGIGLYSSRKYIEEIKGKIELLKSDEKETVFRVILPVL